jgi:lipopolysaccharide biosynthesis protein
VTLGPDVAILCHWDPAGAVRPDTARYIRELAEAGFSVVVVSNGVPVRPEVVATLTGAAIFLNRRNIGIDFGAWRMAMRTLALPRAETKRILLINDSVYGPLVPLAPLLARMTPDAADLWGMTDSRERGLHLQSYFLLANESLIHSRVWRLFWRWMISLPSKRWMVGRYEIGLSRRIRRAGFRVGALFPYETIVSDGSVANPTLEEWRALLAAGFPFLKRELLRDNPTGVVGLDAWRTMVSTEYADEIDGDLAPPINA